MNENYLPVYPKASKVVPEIVNFYWSPQNLLKPQKCMGALLTSSGAVEIVLQIDRIWITVHEFTPAWIQVVNEDFELIENNQTLDAKFFKQKLDRLFITTITWSSLQNEQSSKCYAFLVTGHRNSEIAVWKIYGASNDSLNEDMKLDVELKFKKKLIEENVKISFLLWTELSEKNYYLIVGFHNGQIGVLKIQEFEGGLTSQFYSTFYCDIDNIPVDSLNVLKLTGQWIEIVAVKGMYLIFFTLNMTGEMINMRYISSPGFSITGNSFKLFFP